MEPGAPSFVPNKFMSVGRIFRSVSSAYLKICALWSHRTVYGGCMRWVLKPIWFDMVLENGQLRIWSSEGSPRTRMAWKDLPLCLWSWQCGLPEHWISFYSAFRTRRKNANHLQSWWFVIYIVSETSLERVRIHFLGGDWKNTMREAWILIALVN